MKKIIIFLAICISIKANAQKENGLLQSNKGVFIYFEKKAAANTKNINYNLVEVSSDISGTWKIIGSAKSSNTIVDFKKQIGQKKFDYLLESKNLKSDAEAWKFIQENPSTNDYGLLVFNPEFMEAMGVLFTHNFNTNKFLDKKINYKIKYFKNNIKTKETEAYISIAEKLAVPKPIFKDKREMDSTIDITWYASRKNMQGVFSANLYKSNNKGAFTFQNKLLAFIPKGKDSLLFSYTDFTNKGDYNKYYIVPTNYAGFEGVPSDTIEAFSVNFNTINQAVNLNAKDTTYGIYLSFDPLPASPLITGIIIQKSRYDKTGYVNIDTIAATSTFYLDEKVLSNVTYYYQLKTLSIKQNDLLPTAWASAIHNNKTNNEALAPVNVKATATNKGVVITWLAQANNENAGFRIYRANNSTEPMQLISLLLKENSFTDTTALDNRRKYAYAVSSLNYSDKESKLSDKVYASPINNTIIPFTPNGLMASAEQGRVLLNWTATAEENLYVVGYNIYKKEIVAEEKIKDKIYKTKELLQSGYKLINEKPIKAANYKDEFNTIKDKYVYYVTAVDNKGIESNATNGLLVEIPKIRINPPGNFAARKVSTGIAISWDKSKQENVIGYIIYKRESNATKSTILIKLDKNGENYTDKLIQKNKTYYYSVAAISTNTIGVACVEKGVFAN